MSCLAIANSWFTASVQMMLQIVHAEFFSIALASIVIDLGLRIQGESQLWNNVCEWIKQWVQITSSHDIVYNGHVDFPRCKQNWQCCNLMSKRNLFFAKVSSSRPSNATNF